MSKQPAHGHTDKGMQSLHRKGSRSHWQSNQQQYVTQATCEQCKSVYSYNRNWRENRDLASRFCSTCFGDALDKAKAFREGAD